MVYGRGKGDTLFKEIEDGQSPVGDEPQGTVRLETDKNCIVSFPLSRRFVSFWLGLFVLWTGHLTSKIFVVSWFVYLFL